MFFLVIFICILLRVFKNWEIWKNWVFCVFKYIFYRFFLFLGYFVGWGITERFLGNDMFREGRLWSLCCCYVGYEVIDIFGFSSFEIF